MRLILHLFGAFLTIVFVVLKLVMRRVIPGFDTGRTWPVLAALALVAVYLHARKRRPQVAAAPPLLKAWH
jgi:hypothetical protein